MKLYASRTGTRRNLDRLRAAGWGLLLSPAGVLRDEGFDDLVGDNGKWTAFTTGQPWDAGRFRDMLDEFGQRMAWVLTPDVVADARASLRETERWLPLIEGRCQRRLVAAQDGMVPADLAPWLGPETGIFLGGSTDWKLANMELFGRFAHEVGCHYHVGRVNTQTRVRLALAAGADSIDGSSGTRFAVTIEPLTSAARGQDLYSPKRAA